MGFGEAEFIRWCTGEASGRRLRVGPGDDAAVLTDGTVLTIDTVVEGIHFESGTPVELVARKAVGAALSDVCAMGAEWETLLVSVQMPKGTDGRALAAALAGLARHFGVDLAGGDTVAARPGGLALAVTATGRLPQPGAAWLRSGACPGDRLVVSGPLGGADGGRHLNVCPRRDIVARLRSADIDVRAALDLSDGLGVDLRRLCEASDVGAEIDAESLPIHTDVPANRDPVAAALGDGEDFELLLALPADVPVPDGLVPIGRTTAGPELCLVRAGEREPWPTRGWQHEF